MKYTALFSLNILLFVHVVIGQNTSIDRQYIVQTFSSDLIIDSEVKVLSKDLNIFLLTLPPWISRDSFENYLKYEKNIKLFNKNHASKSIERCDLLPNDSLYKEQWGLKRIQAPKLWCNSVGGVSSNGDSIVIGVLEARGIYYKHQDLLPNIWRNKKEIAGNNLDDDNNGYIDDCHGINCDTQNGTILPHSHGAAVLGVLGAVGNNSIGVSGVNHHVKMMLASEAIYESDWIVGLNYFLQMRKLFNKTNGVQGVFIPVVNISAGFDYGKAEDFKILCSLLDELGKEGILVVGSVINSNIDIDVKGDIPADCSSNYLITVSNSTSKDLLYQNAAFGKKNVDIAAPGDDIMTTGLGNKYWYQTGTSLAAPFVSGGIALLNTIESKEWMEKVNVNPSEAALEMKNFIMQGADKNTNLQGLIKSGGRLNLETASKLMEQQYTKIKEISIAKIFPNPCSADEKLKLEFITNTYTEHQINIYNLTGQVIAARSYFPENLFNNSIELDMSNYSQGFYFLALSNGNSTKIGKFLVINPG